MLASQRHNEEMQRSRLPQKRHATAQPQCQELQLRALFFPSYKELFKGSFVKPVAGRDRQRDRAVQLFFVEKQQVTNEIRDQEPVGSQPLEPEWKKLELRCCIRGASGLSSGKNATSGRRAMYGNSAAR